MSWRRKERFKHFLLGQVFRLLVRLVGRSPEAIFAGVCPFLIILTQPLIYGLFNDTVGKPQGGSRISVEAEMCQKVQAPWPIPAETERIGWKLLAENDVYRLIGDRLIVQLKKAEYADLYAIDGKPEISPIILAFAWGLSTVSLENAIAPAPFALAQIPRSE